MATKFFKHVDARECEAAKSSGKVGLCNLTGHKIEVDEDGRFIPPRGHAIIDKVNPTIQSLVAKGQVKINDTVTEQPKPSRSKKKEEAPSGFNPDATDGDGDGFVQDGTVHERPVEAAAEEVAVEAQEVSSGDEEV